MEIRKFAATVTNHLLDQNYKTYDSSQKALLQETAPAVLVQLRAKGVCVNNTEEVKAFVEKCKSTKRTSNVFIQTVVDDNPDKQGFVRVEVEGKTTTSANSVTSTAF